ncbi:MAG: GNAT family N-acetyltransferase [Myxococcota bacterium]
MRVRTAVAADEPTVVRTLDLAFANDPFVGWLVGERSSSAPRRTYFSMVFRRLTLPFGGAFVVGDGEGVALWAPPNAWDLGLWRSLRILPEVCAVVGWTRMIKVARALEPIERSRPPQPWWLLALLGTDPAHQGSGVGSALLRHQLAACDERNEPAVLDTCVEANVGFYARHGFEVLQTTNIAGGPRCWTMLRPPGA